VGCLAISKKHSLVSVYWRKSGVSVVVMRGPTRLGCDLVWLCVELLAKCSASGFAVVERTVVEGAS
jgi:hypothetical protein